MDSAASFEARLDLPLGYCELSYSLDPQSVIASVGNDGANGAIAVFIGLTRKDNLDGKIVARLEYQAYTKLAIKTMANVIQEVYSATFPSDSSAPIAKFAVHHRLGVVPVGEASIVIAVSAPHRKEAFAACESVLEEVKAKCQIWKREFYENEADDRAEWKANR
ncbi:Molybdenum cofactor synthesis 2 [Mycena indigotica]|uniref:Molybdenum cofactor synthesis 2 n=1 Tax=Mycena indigotica TaxID=2126181 RepID=A0A8H6SXE7_9AGAR|nr:Molybdenum cofactor synthesis 2 [Mycena indigotica]KAF7306885.1 Molybdenum cofactor synthesis 2 [Mycena indigotica]